MDSVNVSHLSIEMPSSDNIQILLKMQANMKSLRSTEKKLAVAEHNLNDLTFTMEKNRCEYELNKLKKELNEELNKHDELRKMVQMVIRYFGDEDPCLVYNQNQSVNLVFVPSTKNYSTPEFEYLFKSDVSFEILCNFLKQEYDTLPASKRNNCKKYITILENMSFPSELERKVQEYTKKYEEYTTSLQEKQNEYDIILMKYRIIRKNLTDDLISLNEKSDELELMDSTDLYFLIQSKINNDYLNPILRGR